MKMKSNNSQKGFTLIEILVVVALIAILAAVTIVALNPAASFEKTRNAQRQADVNTILNAITQFTSEEGRTIDELGTMVTCDPANPATLTMLGTGTGNLNLAAPGLLVDEYIVAIPKDPSGDDTNTLYGICRTAGGRVEVHATAAEGGKDILAKR